MLIQISLPNILSFLSMWIMNFYNLKVVEIFKNENYVSAYALCYTWCNLIILFLFVNIIYFFISLTTSNKSKIIYNIIINFGIFKNMMIYN